MKQSEIDQLLNRITYNPGIFGGKAIIRGMRFRVVDMLELLALNEAKFKSRFAGTPLRRIKRRGLVRNVCVALGNTGDASALPALQTAAGDSEPLIAEHARWAIGQIQARRTGC